VTINSVKEFKYSTPGSNVVDEGPLQISTNIKDVASVMTTCTLTPLDGSASSCGSCVNDTMCDFNITDPSQADIIAVGVEVAGMQCSWMEMEILVTSKSSKLRFFLQASSFVD
jgi:hypothetical protein